MSTFYASSYDFDRLPEWTDFRAVYRKGDISLYLGYSAGYNELTLWIQCQAAATEKLPTDESSDSVRVRIGSKSNERINIYFELIDSSLQEPFLSFCRDFRILLQYDKHQNTDVAQLVLRRMADWRELLKRRKGWSQKRMKGVITELTFLADDLAGTIGIDEAVNAWEGPFGGDQDFQTEAGWIEVKSTVSGNNHIHISSVEQLDAMVPGKLVVIELDKASPNAANTVTVTGLVDTIRERLTSSPSHIRRRFEDALQLLGYETAIISKPIAFLRKGTRSYRVTPDTFPCIRRTHLPIGIDSVKYVLDLSVAEAFKE